MAHIDRRRFLDKERYTLYGQWFLFACSLLGVDQKEVAARMDLDAGAVSKHLRRGKNEPERESVKRAIAALRKIAQEKHKVWDASWDDLIMHASGKATDSEMAASEQQLDLLIAQHPPEC